MTNSQLRNLKALCAVLMSSTLMACGSGFQSQENSSAAAGTGGDNISLGDGSQVTTEKAWNMVQSGVDGTVEGGTNSGSLVIQIDKARQSVILILPLPPIFLLPISGMSIPELPGASVEMVDQPDGSKAMGVVIPLKYIVKGGTFGDYGKLPNGDNVPFIPVGEARGFAISFPQKPSYRLHIYFAVNAAAVFIETPDWKFPDELALLPTMGFPVKNEEKTQVVGYFAIVPNRGSFASGVYVAARIPRQLAIVIDELIRY